MALGRHLVTQAQGIFIDSHGANSKRSLRQDGPVMGPWGSSVHPLSSLCFPRW
jgi:hypothetical protein